MGNHNFHIYIYIPNICVCYYKWDILTIPLFFNWQEINVVYMRYIPLSDKPILLSYYLLIGINKSGLLRKNTPYIYIYITWKKCKFLFHDFPCQPAFQRGRYPVFGNYWSPPLQFIQLHRASGYDLWPYSPEEGDLGRGLHADLLLTA